MINAKDAYTLSSAYFEKNSNAEVEKIKKQVEAEIEEAIKHGRFSISLQDGYEFHSTFPTIIKWLESLEYKVKKTREYVQISWI